METEDLEEQDRIKNQELNRTEQVEIYEKLTFDLNNKIQDIPDPIVSDASKFRPFAFGDNRNNACGTLSECEQNFVYAPLRIQEFKKIAAGFYHSLGVNKDGAMYSWGKNKFNQLGRNAQDEKPGLVRGVLFKVKIKNVACGW